MKKSLFVAGLDYSLTEEALKNIFSEFGNVELAKIIKDKYSGQSRGFGFVDMASQEEAQLAINKLNGATHKDNNDRPFVVKFKEEKSADSNRSRGGFKSRW